MAALYREGLGVEVVKVSSPKTANAVKLTENLFRDVNIALANEFALLYEKFGIDTVEVINACATKLLHRTIRARGWAARAFRATPTT